MAIVVQPPKWKPIERPDNDLEGLVKYRNIWVDENLTQEEKEEAYRKYQENRPMTKGQKTGYIAASIAIGLALLAAWAHFQVGMF